MHEHGPDDLIGPIRGTAAWWRGMGAPPDIDDEGPPAETKAKKKYARSIRTELVERVRDEIAAGTYETQERWEAALERLLERLHD
jgi:hypothetical protein